MRLLSSDLLFQVGTEGGNSMGLILEARSPFSPFISTSLNLGSFFVFRVVLHCQNRKRRLQDVFSQTGQAFIQNSVQ